MKLKIVTPSTAHARDWQAALAALQPAFEVTTIEQPLHRVNVLVNGSRPDLVVVETTDLAEFEALERLAQAHPELEYVLVAGDLSPEFLMRAMRCGVREVLPAPALAASVVDAVQRLTRKRSTVAAPAPNRGEVLAFVSSKGGSGATFIAANLAHILASREGCRVALFDLNLQFGDAVLFVSSVQPTSNVADVARNIQRLDPELLQASMVQIAPQFWVLPAPEDPARAGDVQPQHVEAMLNLARTMFDYVIVDAGRSLSAVSLKALDLCDRLYVVLQLTLPFIRDARRLREVFMSLDYPAKKIHWIVNRHQKTGELTLDDLKRSLGISELVLLPNQYDVVASSVNQGLPVDKLAPSSTITRALRELAVGIAPERPRARSGWLSGLFRGAQP